MDCVGGGGGGGKAEPGPLAVDTTIFLFSSLLSPFLPLLLFFCKGDPYPEICARRTLGEGDFFCCGLHAGAAAGLLCHFVVYIPLRGERR